MKKLLFASMLLATVSATQAFADSTNNANTRVYTFYGVTHQSVPDPVTVKLKIDSTEISGQLQTSSANDYGYLELPNALVGHQITSASFTWPVQGKLYVCKADNVPAAILQAGDLNSATQLDFTCK